MYGVCACACMVCVHARVWCVCVCVCDRLDLSKASLSPEKVVGNFAY